MSSHSPSPNSAQVESASALSACAKPQRRRLSAMVLRKKVVDAENPEWTAEDFARAKPAKEVLSADVMAAFGKRRGPQKAPKKVPVSIRLSPDVVAHFRGKGRGWQSEIDDMLRSVIETRFDQASGRSV